LPVKKIVRDLGREPVKRLLYATSSVME